MADQHCIRQFRMGMMITLFILQGIYPAPIEAQSGTAKIKVTGTGNTTGVIANLSFTNSTGAPVKINPQTCYIPSDGQYQPYIVSIPGHTFPPGTTTIPIDGYCADVHTPPVPNGNDLPPVEEWIPVGNTGTTTPDGGINLLPTPTVPTFLPKDIPNLIRTPGYTSIPSDPESDIITTWPGTDIPVGGNIDPVNFPERFAPVLVDALDKIIAAFDESKGEGKIVTPFSGDAERERESVIQQTFWIYAAGITGKRYEEEQFHAKVVEQFEDKTGTTMETIPLEEKEKLESGINQFWNTFTAVGVEAKIVGKKDSETTHPAETIPIQHHEDLQCTIRDTLLQVYSRGQNNEDQLKQQADMVKNGIAMYETAQFELEWTLFSNCNCAEPDKTCNGDITVGLRFVIVNLKEDHGDPTEYLLLPVQAPPVNQSTKATDRSGNNTNGELKPGPNVHMHIPEVLEIEGDHVRFVEQSRLSDQKHMYVAESSTTIPCLAGTYPVRFLVKQARSKNHNKFERSHKHRMKNGLNLFADAIITVQQTNCKLNSTIKGFAAEFRTAWDPKDITSINQKGQRITIKIKDELAQVRLNGNKTPIYYNLLKLIKEGSRDIDSSYSEKERGVRPGE